LISAALGLVISVVVDVGVVGAAVVVVVVDVGS
jgi:hypothetical protein